MAQGWLALELTGDAFLVGVVSAAGTFPVLLFALYAGVLADRYDRLRLVLGAQALLLIQASLLWWFQWSANMSIGWLFALALFGGTVNALDIPARQSLIIDLVGREDLLDAIALNSSGFNLARIIGPSIAAVIIARFGLAWCFALNALSYGAVLIGLLRIHLPRQGSRAVQASPREGLWQGLAYMRRTREVAALMRMVAVYSIFGVPYLVLLPVIARDVLLQDARAYGFLLTCVGIGALIAALALAAVGQRVRRGRLLASASYAFALLLIAFSLSRSLHLSAALLLGVGFTMILTNALTNTLLQTIVPDALRGRVMAAYAFVFVGMGPFGALFAGSVARLLGAPAAVGVGAAITLVYAVWAFSRNPNIMGL